MSLSKRERACRELNRELSSVLGYREIAHENGEDVGGQVKLSPVSKVPFSPFWGSVHFGIVEHALIYDTKDNKPYKGEWMREEKTRIERPTLDAFTGDYHNKVTTTKSLQSPENTEANNRKWRNRGRVVSKEARKQKVLITGEMLKRLPRSERMITDNSALLEANERTASGDYRKYFR